MARKRKLTPTTADRSEMLSLLDAAKDEPFDPSRRLVLADWLEEHGGDADRARAQVIRLQLDADAGGVPWSRTVEKLRDKYVREWMTPAHRAMCRTAYPVCESGLLCATTPAAYWPADAVADEAWRWVETARLPLGRPSSVQTFMASPLVATVAHLDFAYQAASAAALRPVLQSAAARRLSFAAFASDLKEIAGLIRPGLSALKLAVGEADGSAWEAFLSADAVAAVPSLALAGKPPPAEQVARLAGRGVLQRLSVELPAGPGRTIGAFAPPSLRTLRTGGANGTDAFAGLADAPCAATLEELTFAGTQTESPSPARLPRLRRLALWKCLDAAAAAGFAELGAFDAPTWLDLSHNDRLGPEGVAAVCASRLRGPTRLELANCFVGDAGLARLAAWPGLADVRVLILSWNRVTDAGVRALAASPYAAGIEALSLESGDITAAGADALMASPLGRNLRWLALGQPAGWAEPAIDDSTRLREYVGG